MAENLIVYAGSRFGKAKKKIVEREAKSQGFPSTAEFVWSAIRYALNKEAQDELKKIEDRENK